MRSTLGTFSCVVVLTTALAGVPPRAGATERMDDTPADPSAERQSQSLLDGWSFAVAPYLWLPAVEGRLGAEGVTTSLDIGIGDVLDLIGDNLSLLAGFGRIEARRGRIMGFVDTSLIRIDTDQSATINGVERGSVSTTAIRIDAKLRQDQALVEFGLGYRVLQYSFLNRSRPFVADVLVGGRYYYYWTQVKATATTKLRGLPSGPQIRSAAGRSTSTIDWADPIVGVRWSVPVLDSLDLGFRGDVGGFGAGSDLAWSLTGMLFYHLPWRPCDVEPDVVVGYRILDFDYESGGDTIDLSMSGPALGLVLRF